MSSILHCDKALIGAFNDINWKIQAYHNALSVKKGDSQGTVTKRLNKENYSICLEILIELFILQMDIRLFQVDLKFLDKPIKEEIANFTKRIDKIGNLHARHAEAYHRQAVAAEKEKRKIFSAKNPFLKYQTGVDSFSS